MKAFFSNVLNKLKNLFKRRNPAEIFIFFACVSFAVYLIFGLIFQKDALLSIFFNKCGDLFMDFFNSLRDVAQGEAVYTERHVIYPPLANLIFLICSKFLPKEYLDTSFEDRYLWVNYSSAYVTVIIFFLILLAVLVFVVAKNFKHNKKVTVLFLIFTVLNLPVAYTVERGNILLISIIATSVFLFNYNSDNKVKREIAAIALAISFAIKIYPVVFGVLYLFDKRYKEALRCALYGILLLILPSFFFGGPKCLITMLQNVFRFSEGGGSVPKLASYSLYVIDFALVIFFVLALIKKLPLWKIGAFGIAIIESVLSLNGLYVWAFMLAPLIMFMNSEKLEGDNILYFVFMALPFMVLPSASPSWFGLHSPFISFWLMLICQTGLIVTIIKDVIVSFKKNKKNQSSDNSFVVANEGEDNA